MCKSLSANDILNNFGGAACNMLETVPNTFSSYEERTQNDDEIRYIHHSPYYAPDNMPDCLKSKHDFNILCLNTGSLLAKIDELKIFIKTCESQDIVFDCICIQESWLQENQCLDLIQLDGYNCYSQGRHCSTKGGLVTYVRSEYESKIFLQCASSNIWEGLFLDISKENSSFRIIVGNIYKPPKGNNNNDNISQVIMELEPILEILDNINCDLVMAGDYNIDLIELNDRHKYTDFFDNMLSISLFPKITLPTRISNTSCTLIDNIYCRLSNNTMDLSSGIVHSGISDHFPCFVSISTGGQTSNSTPTVIKKVINSQKAMSNFIEEISSVDFTSKLNTDMNSNPDTNYNIFINTILDVKNKHFPKTFAKLRKHKHKINKWITYGIIRSIKNRDAMHLTLKRASPHAAEYPTLKHNISVFNKKLKKAIREAKNEYYSNLFEQCKNDMKKTWQNISRILNKSNKNKNKIKKILVNGNITTNKATIAEAFNSFFVNIGPKLADRLISLIKNRSMHIWQWELCHPFTLILSIRLR